MLKDERIITPTIRALMDRKTRKREELFVAAPLSELRRVASLGPNASFLFTILYSIHRMQPKKEEFFPVRVEFEEAVGRGHRWWQRHAKTLEDGGIVEVQRKAGMKPRFRLLPSNAETAVQ